MAGNQTETIVDLLLTMFFETVSFNYIWKCGWEDYNNSLFIIY